MQSELACTERKTRQLRSGFSSFPSLALGCPSHRRRTLYGCAAALFCYGSRLAEFERLYFLLTASFSSKAFGLSDAKTTEGQTVLGSMQAGVTGGRHNQVVNYK